MGKLNSLAVVGVLLCIWAAPLSGQGPANIPGAVPPPAMEASHDELRTSEPYALAGHRLVFSSWYFVRPGTFGWLNARGENVAVGGSEGPWGANISKSAGPHGVRLRVLPGERFQRTLKSEMPWEAKGLSMSSVLQVDGRYRAWGHCQDAQGKKHFCTFESADGLTWTRPSLGQIKIDGRDTNLIDFNGGTVFYDAAAPPEERYKCVELNDMSRETFEAYRAKQPDAVGPRAWREDVGVAFYIAGAVSPDGLTWTPRPEPLAIEHSDTQITAYYDAQLRKYVIYTRQWMVGPQAPGSDPSWGRIWYNIGRRSIGRTESDNFDTFPLSQIILVPPLELPPSEVLYTNCRTSVPGAPDHHVMFPAVWSMRTDDTHIRVASSHDGRVWTWVPGGSVFETPAFGEWDGGCVFTNPNLIELADGSFVLPYTGYEFPHKYPRGNWSFGSGYIRWPKGRLFALESPEEGVFETVGIMPPGRKLRINALTERAGSIVVEVANIHNDPLDNRRFEQCEPIRGDRFDHPVTWQGQDDLGVPENTPVILRFRMDHAAIFALDFE